MIDDISRLSSDILQIITERYLTNNNRTIPDDILKLKDETMSIFGKSHNEKDPAVIKQYERRLGEIREILEKG